MNFEQARFNMVEQQIRPWEVLDSRVLSLLETIHREDFVPVRYRKLAFADISIPLDCGQVMMRPKVEARMLQALELDEDDTVLEIGTGSGFITACLADLAKRVVSVEIFPELHETAALKLKDKGIENVELFVGATRTGSRRGRCHRLGGRSAGAVPRLGQPGRPAVRGHRRLAGHGSLRDEAAGCDRMDTGKPVRNRSAAVGERRARAGIRVLSSGRKRRRSQSKSIFGSQRCRSH